jgi:ribose transport system substrate-binding protein
LEEAAQAYPDVRLVVRDNNLDDAQAIANAHEFAQVPVDVAIIFHINERIGPELTQPFFRKGIPVVAVDIPMPLATYFGANNKEAGRMAGHALGQWIQQHWGGQVDKVLAMTDSRVVSVVRERVSSVLEGLHEVVDFSDNNLLYLDSQSQQYIAMQRSLEVLERWDKAERIAVVCLSDDSAIGVLQAARQLGRESHIAICGQGGEADSLPEIANPTSAFIATTDYRLDTYGPRLMELAYQLALKQRLPHKHYVEHHLIAKAL